MKKQVIIGGLAGATAAGAALTALALKSRNNLLDQHKRLLTARADFEECLSARRGLVGPLLNSVKGAFSNADYERQSAVLTALTGNNVHVGSDAVLSHALPLFFKVADGYKSLGTNPEFLDLREQLEAEARTLAGSRSRYLTLVREYNRFFEHKGGGLVARVAGLSPEDELSIEEV